MTLVQFIAVLFHSNQLHLHHSIRGSIEVLSLSEQLPYEDDLVSPQRLLFKILTIITLKIFSYNEELKTSLVDFLVLFSHSISAKKQGQSMTQQWKNSANIFSQFFQKFFDLFKFFYMSSCENQVSNQGEVAKFIKTTFQLLQNQDLRKIISWSSTGKEFIIKDIYRFEQMILPCYFRHHNMSSFVRQLNMYDFRKSRKDSSKCIFSHSQFQKDRKEYLSLIKRKTSGKESKLRTPKKTLSQLEKKTPRTFNETNIKDIKKNKEDVEEENGKHSENLEQKENQDIDDLNLNASIKRLTFNSLGENLKEYPIEDNVVSIEEKIKQEECEEKQKFPSVSMFLNADQKNDKILNRI